MNDAILNIAGITKSFARNIKKGNGENGTEKHTVLDNFSMSVEKGKITSLIGGNGSGKTTLFNIIAGLLTANYGNIHFINGKVISITGLAPHRIARLGIGRLFQDAHVFPELSILDNMLLADNNRFGEQPFYSLIFQHKIKNKEKNRIERTEQVFAELFKDDKTLLDRFSSNLFEPAKNLSYGQQRLLAIARLFMAENNKLFLLDEPTSGVNPAINKRIASIIKSVVVDKGLSIFLIEHNMRFMAEVSDICAFINKGKVEYSGTPDEVLNNEQVKKSYLGA